MDCPICLSNITSDVMTTTCGHSFHNECINGWKTESPSCPVCRSILPYSQVLPLHVKLDTGLGLGPGPGLPRSVHYDHQTNAGRCQCQCLTSTNVYAVLKYISIGIFICSCIVSCFLLIALMMFQWYPGK